MPGLKIVVVGAGMVGVSTAEWLRRDGHEVTLIDRVPPGSDRQTSYGNAGMLARCAVVPVPVPGLLAKVPGMLLARHSPLFMRWSRLPVMAPWLLRYLNQGREARVRKTAEALSDILMDSVDQHRALSRGTAAERLLRDCEYLYFYKDRAAYDADAFGWNLRADMGLKTRFLDRAEMERQAPGLAPGIDFGVALLDHATIRDPGAYVAALARHFEEQGGGVRQAEVTGIEPQGEGVSVLAGGERLSADRVVLAGGIWSAKLAERLGHRSEMQSERGYHVMLKNPSRQPEQPIMMPDGKFVLTPMEGGLRVAGLVEYGGLGKPPATAPLDYLKQGARRVLPDLTWDGEEIWDGHRPTTVDSLPFIGPSPKTPQVFFAYGAQHIGLTSGPKTGRLIADLIGGRRPNIDLAPFRVGRFD